MNKLLLTIAVFLTLSVGGQLPLEWTEDFKGIDASEETPHLLKKDINGNIYSVVKTYAYWAIVKYDNNNDLLFSKVFPTSNFYSSDDLNDLCADNNDNVIAVGGKDGRLFMTKLDSTGNVLWSKSDWNYIFGTKVLTDSFDNIYVTGKTATGEVQTSKYSSDGEEQWTTQFTSLMNVQSISSSHMLMDQNFLYVGGTASYTTTDNVSFVLIKYDLNGNEIWNFTKSAGDVFGNVLRDMMLDSQGNITIIGVKIVSFRDKLHFFKSDPDGNIIQDEYLNYTGSAFTLSQGFYGHIDAADNLYIVGYKEVNFDDNLELVKYDASGNYLWHNTYNINEDTRPTGIAENVNGEIVIAFNEDIGNSLVNSHIRSYYPAGDVHWTVTADTSNIGFVLSDSGNINLSTFSVNPLSQKDQTFLKYNMDGTLIDEIHYNGRNRTNNKCIATASNDNSLFSLYKVQSLTPSGTSYIMLYSYDQSGNINWTDTLSGYFNESPAFHVTNSSIYMAFLSGTSSVKTYKVDASDGDILWETTNPHHSSYVADITTDPVGDVYVYCKGNFGSSSQADKCLLYKYDGNTGIQVWEQEFNRGQEEDPASITYHNNAVYTYGNSRDWGDWSDAMIQKYDLDGNLVYTSLTNIENFRVFTNDIIFDDLGHIYISGVQTSTGLPNTYIAKIDEATGTNLWTNILGDAIDNTDSIFIDNVRHVMRFRRDHKYLINKKNDGNIQFIGTSVKLIIN